MTHMSKSAIYFANDQPASSIVFEQVEMNLGDAWENCFDCSLCTYTTKKYASRRRRERKFAVNFLRV